MDDKINEHFVGVHPDSGGIWSFTLPGEIARISESIGRVEDIVHELFDACEGFIRLTGIEYFIWTYSGDGPVESIDPRNEIADVKLLSSEKKELSDDIGLTADDIPFESFVDRSENFYFISEIESTRVQTRIRLSNYDGWVDRTNNQYVKPARLRKVYDGQAKRDPIAIRLYHIPVSSQTLGTNMGFVISISSPTNIWFEETPIGRVNRRRLEAFFERLYDRLDIVDTTVTSSRKNETLRELLPK